MQFGLKGIAIIPTVLLTLASCSDDVDKGTSVISGREICFAPSSVAGSRAIEPAVPVEAFDLVCDRDSASFLHCSVETSSFDNDPSSRALSVTDPSSVNRIGVIAHASWFAPLLMDNDLYERDASNGTFQCADKRYWIDDASATIDFYAFTPYQPTGLTLPDTKESTVLSYSVPAEAADQIDLMLAVRKGVRADYNQAVELAFRHLLAGVRVRFTAIPAGWNVRSIRFSGINMSGSLDFAAATPVWTQSGSRDAAMQTAGDVGVETLFMTIPQTYTSADKPVTLEVVVNDGTADRTFTSDLTSIDWAMGKITTYNISVNDYKFEIDTTQKPDAHYVIYKTVLKVSNVPATKGWTITASSDDNADITMELQSAMNEYSAQGFWTDKLIDTNGSQTSARGQAALTGTGSGEFPVAIYLPENIGDKDREIRLTVNVAGNNSPVDVITFAQHHPAWTSGGFGWEQTDDLLSGEYGFKWDRIVYYGYVYGFFGSSNTTYRNYCQSIIDSNNAGSYASVETYDYRLTQHRYCIKIEYGKLNNLSGVADNTVNGLSNTRNLFNRAGSATTNSFEDIIKSIKKTESGKEDEDAFRIGNGERNEAPAPSGSNINGSAAVGECIKKNRYNLRRSVTTQSGTQVISVTPEIKTEDIVWYLPAVDQFSTAPESVQDPINAGDYWSSTAVTNASDAYLGNKSVVGRLTTHKVRAVRNRP